MRIFDAHCDLLYQLWRRPEISEWNDLNLHVTIEKLFQFGAKVQCFAIFIPVEVTNKLEAAFAQASIFFNRIINGYEKMIHIRTKQDLLALKDDEIGAILTLEGCEPIGHDLSLLSIFQQLGVRSAGLTWNFANLLADGALETRNAGLSFYGRHVVEKLNHYHMWTDISHLSERSFWDVIQLADYPIASHSNSYALCPHPRNLRDDQIKAIVAKKGLIGITFVPQFTSSGPQASMKHLLNHLDYVCGLAGENAVGLGSDFDGIDETIEGLEGYEQYPYLLNTLLKHYSESQVEKFMYKNFAESIPF
ncbi:dipeptidase [Metabacillus idriensis]|uniref:Membrane dipeptidase n=1 Tax=Metabacillus idriensis TaxID=324768 RepID=A0A6I2M8L0_9BACI|nr:dipeptidase [Metabacillus idriensis]MCM3594222.1 dipeptidase [Metabacillus idriensis]MRX53747.1 membrane dipeptidase [Metabacillus idriensis]OHR64783.1 diguanylate cyclase [Bacillus sp. HMSC76G11]